MMRNACVFVLTSLVLAAIVVTAARRYDGYRVILVVPATEFQLTFLVDLMLSHTQLDFWEEPKRLGDNVVVMVAPEDYELLLFEMGLQDLPVTLLNSNVQAAIDEDKVRHSDRSMKLAYDYNDFNLYEDYMSETDALAADCPADVTCTVSVIGQSYNGLDIKLLHIDTGAGRDFFMDSCIHAREWLACATLMNIVNHMIRNSTDEVADEVLKSHNWYIVPIANPDGYKFSHDEDRLWRKSRNINEGSDCMGTDLNRNHDFQWNTGGTSTNPCSDTFHGSGPASEPEIQALQGAGLNTANQITVWLTMHTYAKMLLWPYGNCTQPENVEDVRRVATATCDAIEDTHNTVWECGNACETLYETSGTTRDWAAGAAGALYSYTAELRGDGFVVGVEEIQPAFEEMWNGVTAAVREVIKIEEEARRPHPYFLSSWKK